MSLSLAQEAIAHAPAGIHEDLMNHCPPPEAREELYIYCEEDDEILYTQRKQSAQKKRKRASLDGEGGKEGQPPKKRIKITDAWRRRPSRSDSCLTHADGCRWRNFDAHCASALEIAKAIDDGPFVTLTYKKFWVLHSRSCLESLTPR